MIGRYVIQVADFMSKPLMIFTRTTTTNSYLKSRLGKHHISKNNSICSGLYYSIAVILTECCSVLVDLGILSRAPRYSYYVTCFI